MHDREKPFILYRSGRGSFKIVPRNGEGWRQTIIWMALMVPLTGGFIWFASRHPEGTPHYIGLALYLAATMAWAIGGILWMRPRSEIVDLEELLALKREQERKRRGD